jgi:hypothetical protein
MMGRDEMGIGLSESWDWGIGGFSDVGRGLWIQGLQDG